MSYTARRHRGLRSVEYIMRDVEWGWLIRYCLDRSSAFFIVVYLHMFAA